MKLHTNHPPRSSIYLTPARVRIHTQGLEPLTWAIRAAERQKIIEIRRKVYSSRKDEFARHRTHRVPSFHVTTRYLAVRSNHIRSAECSEYGY